MGLGGGSSSILYEQVCNVRYMMETSKVCNGREGCIGLAEDYRGTTVPRLLGQIVWTCVNSRTGRTDRKLLGILSLESGVCNWPVVVFRSISHPILGLKLT